ncbi:MAG TPA: hypothetical protein VGR07_08015 [Thermoanaerobaculia bacterium]|nr:hypothetical protein [Thermoanaerobaculia bacterium]
MSGREDRLFDLLPAVYRQRDAEQGSPLQALLRVIAEQVNVVEDDIARLYENWFVETCDDWAVPYIADLIGYRPVHSAGEPGGIETAEERRRNQILIPRREVANTLRYRRRKGTLALLEQLAEDVAGWPARAVEFYRLLAFTQHLGHLDSRHRHRGRTVDLRRGEALDRLSGPLDELAHNADVRRVASPRTPGRPNLPGVGLYLWRLRSYSVTRTPAYLTEESACSGYTVSVLGNDMPLYVRPEPTPVADGLNLPIPIRRRAFERHKDEYYGAGKSLEIWVGEPKVPSASQVVPASNIVVADLSDWKYQPRDEQVAVDPELGRIAFPPHSLAERGVWISYQYGFSADLGGGEYDRPLSQPAGAVVYRVGEGEPSATIGEALARWQAAQPLPLHAVIEITDSSVYVEKVNLVLPEKHTLQLRAAQRRRPVIRLLDWETSLADSLTVKGGPGSAFTLDGLLVTGRGVRIHGNLAAVTLRHSTLVPGWGLHGDCKPRRSGEPSLELVHLAGRVAIEHCILGSIEVVQNEVTTDPLPLRLSDSILDATGREREALSAPGHPVAHVRLTVLRSTVFGQVAVHALELGENSLFTGHLLVARRQIGCLRFSSYVPGSRTPKRFACQPDLVEQATASLPEAARQLAKQHERERVCPLFRTVRYGSPDYARLADDCAEEIRRGADDESEMGAFHDLFAPQRAANLAARLDEYTPAGSDAGLIFAD